tara:strand:- start:366 stop:566 length:201 start_codon:yes stop_codon:yes gene_type:complete
MKNPKPIFKSPYDLKDVSALFLIVAFVLIFSAIIGNNLFGVFQENINFGNILVQNTFERITYVEFL